MKRFDRMDRVSELVHREVSTIIDRELRDTRIGMVTVTGVEVSRNLRNAKIFVTILGVKAEIKSSIGALNDASAYIRKCLGERIVLKYLPELKFYFDSTLAEGMRIDKLFDEINKQS